MWESSSPLSQGHPLSASLLLVAGWGFEQSYKCGQSCGSQDLAGQVGGFGG